MKYPYLGCLGCKHLQRPRMRCPAWKDGLIPLAIGGGALSHTRVGENQIQPLVYEPTEEVLERFAQDEYDGEGYAIITVKE